MNGADAPLRPAAARRSAPGAASVRGRAHRLAIAATLVALLGACASGMRAGATRDPAPSAGPSSTVHARTAPPSAGTGSTTTRVSPPTVPSAPVLPPANANFDYQLGGPYTPPVGVTMVSRDRTAAPAPGLYNVCYVNGFQTQPDERAWWLANHPSAVLRDVGGNPVIDPDWPDEYILDTSTAPKRAEIAAVVGAWIEGCASSGYQAVEIDNLDTYTRFPQLTENDAVALVSAYRATAHAAGLAIAQKNTAELVVRKAETGLDFAVAEQCGEYDECDVYVDGYGSLVYVIEYDRDAFDADCLAFPQLGVVLRDVELTTPGSGAYVRDAC